MAVGDETTYRRPHGAIVIREGGEHESGEYQPWLVTWLPDDRYTHTYPGSTYSSSDHGIPDGPTVAAVLEWALTQRWAQPPEA